MMFAVRLALSLTAFLTIGFLPSSTTAIEVPSRRFSNRLPTVSSDCADGKCSMLGRNENGAEFVTESEAVSGKSTGKSTGKTAARKPVRSALRRLIGR
jgi:hypothetical protein